MPNFSQFRILARQLFDEALRAVDAGRAVRESVRIQGSSLIVRDQQFDLQHKKIYSIAIGKAAVPMSLALEAILGPRLEAGVVSSPFISLPKNSDRANETRALSSVWRQFHGGHPLPNEQSLRAASEALALLNRANRENALVIFLISGGGSAMMERPITENITVADLRVANEVLIDSGASIIEVNAGRRAFSAVKGGRLAAHASDCDQISLVVSDVPIGQETNVASGPSIAPSANSPSAREVIDLYKLRAELPASIIRAIDNVEPLMPKATTRREYFTLLDNTTALEAAAEAARQRGCATEIASDISDQPIEEGCQLLLTRLKALRSKYRGSDQIACVVSGGEFSCPVRGNGIGGRNLETALRIARTLSDAAPHTVALFAGTDGIDGNSSAAGAIVDSTTIGRARAMGLDAYDHLLRSDSYPFFATLGDTITVGATGTNVRDVRIMVSQC